MLTKIFFLLINPIRYDVHLPFLYNYRNVKLVTHHRQYQNHFIKIQDYIYDICIDITLMFLKPQIPELC